MNLSSSGRKSGKTRFGRAFQHRFLSRTLHILVARVAAGVLRPQNWFVRCEFSSLPRPEPIPERFRAEAAQASAPHRLAFLPSLAHHVLSSLASVLSPDLCFLCNQPLIRFSAAPVCGECWSTIRTTPTCLDPCFRCGASLARFHKPSSPDALCRVCRFSLPPFTRVVTFATYRDQMRLAIHALKYSRILPMSRPLGRMLAEAIASMTAEAPPSMLVVPVPLHPRRQRERGFNQARLLAYSALQSLRQTHPGWQLQLSPASLVRHRETTPQALLTPHQRRTNLARAFRVAQPRQIKGRNILLVDDIVTTGATARACAQALLDAGAASVSIAALARAQLSMESGRWIPSDALDSTICDHHDLLDFLPADTHPPTPHPT